MRAHAYELIVDLFAGGGGASEGIRLALGREPDIAVNHDDDALSMHAANHPATRHIRRNLHEVDPFTAIGDAPIGLLWASPDCTHHSKAKGGKPVKRHRERESKTTRHGRRIVCQDVIVTLPQWLARDKGLV